MGDDMATDNMERRTCAGELRVVMPQMPDSTEEMPMRLAGHGAVFNQETVIWGMWREVIMPGAFTEAIKTDDVRALLNHDSNLVLGRNKSGTLRLEEDAQGLRYEIDPPNTSYANDLMVVVDRGDVSQSSFQFSIDSSDWEEWDESEVKLGKLPLRKIKRVRLYDVSPVTFPAFEGTDVQVSARAKEAAEQIVRTARVPLIAQAEAAEAEERARMGRLDRRRRLSHIAEAEAV